MEPDARRAFETTALPHMDTLYGAAVRMTRDPSLAEDLVQDAMVRAYRFWHSFRPGTSVKAWLLTILRNTFINGYHRRNRARSFEREVERQVGPLGQHLAVGQTAGELPSPEEATLAAITRARIEAALDAIPEDYRTAVTLADLEGLTYKEIAEVMDCPIGTVMSRIYRGRRLLHRLLLDHAAEVGLVAPSAEAEDPGDDASPISLAEFRHHRGTA